MTTKRLWQLHSWIGLICGAALLVIGLTGALLVFHDDIEALVHPHMLVVQPSPAGRLPLDRLVGTMQKRFPDYAITYWIISRVPRWADTVYLVRHGETEVRFATVDPFWGEIRAPPSELHASFTGWMLDLHYTFFAGNIGIAITGVLALLLCLLGLSGFWLYRGFWRNLFRLRWDHSARIFFSDFHKMIGISSVILFLILGITGAYFNAIQLLAYFRAGTPATARPNEHFYAARISFDRLLAEAQKKLPGFEVGDLALPTAPNGSIFFGGRIAGQSTVRSDYGSNVTFDARTGAFQQATEIHRTSAWNQVVDTFVPLHYGTFGGLPIKILWCFAGLTPGCLAISGCAIWRTRRPGRRRPTRNEKAAAPLVVASR